MILPTFLIIGAAKAGTTALYEYCRQHPDIYMSPLKETNFFAYEGEASETYWISSRAVPVPLPAERPRHSIWNVLGPRKGSGGSCPRRNWWPACAIPPNGPSRPG